MDSGSKHIFIEIASVTDKSGFEKIMNDHFHLRDQGEFWKGLFLSFTYLPNTTTITFIGWTQFQNHMPRYARRLKRMLDDYMKITQKRILKVEYA